MRSALSEILDGCIGHIGPGYHAPAATVNIDEVTDPVVQALAKERTDHTCPSYEVRQALARENAELRKEISKMMRVISSPDSPVPAREVWLRLKRPSVKPFRVGQLLMRMALRGEIERAAAPYVDDHNQRVWLYWVERTKK